MGRLGTFYNWCIFHRDGIASLFVMPFPVIFLAFFLVGSFFDMGIAGAGWLSTLMAVLVASMWITGPMLIASPIIGLLLYKDKRQKIIIAGAAFWVAALYLWQFLIDII